ncbi:hypothetical protein G4G28_22910 [Massilia sp. Dwa41.01b]|nr:flagellar assembly protein T N-terminal domain-containing protein [Massilia sp. Dwa41.01b]QNA90649.1 hypothetical protein G4G28_22910 [Massilia sp. Dwa41.01b]
MPSKAFAFFRAALAAILVPLLLAASALPAFSAPIEAEGVAAIAEGGVAKARQNAIRDALEQLGLRSAARVEVAAGASSRGTSFDSSRVQPAAEFDRYSVLREWQTGQLLHVRIAVKEEDAPARQRQPRLQEETRRHALPLAQLTPARRHRRHRHPPAPELLRRMTASGRFLGKASPYVVSPGASGPAADTAAVRRIATMHESQFVISGEIVDASRFEQPAYYGLWKRRARRIEIAFFVHDGLTGTLLARHTAVVEQPGEGTVGRDKPFGSASFAATPFGGAILRALDEGIAAIAADLAPPALHGQGGAGAGRAHLHRRRQHLVGGAGRPVGRLSCRHAPAGVRRRSPGAARDRGNAGRHRDDRAGAAGVCDRDGDAAGGSQAGQRGGYGALRCGGDAGAVSGCDVCQTATPA